MISGSGSGSRPKAHRTARRDHDQLAGGEVMLGARCGVRRDQLHQPGHRCRQRGLERLQPYQPYHVRVVPDVDVKTREPSECVGPGSTAVVTSLSPAAVLRHAVGSAIDEYRAVAEQHQIGPRSQLMLLH